MGARFRLPAAAPLPTANTTSPTYLLLTTRLFSLGTYLRTQRHAYQKENLIHNIGMNAEPHVPGWSAATSHVEHQQGMGEEEKKLGIKH